MQRAVPITIMRGGTSRGIFFLEQDLPPAGELRDKVILRVFGSPDPKQIDGLGGAASVTSKGAIIGPPSVPDADVNYTFVQVSINTSLVDIKGNCGNISSAVGPFAIEKGFVKPVEPFTTVRIYNTNTKKIIVAEVPVRDGHVVYEGDYRIAGVPGTAAKIMLDFQNPAGAVTGKLLPTGKVREELETAAGTFSVSIVDAANPLVFVKAGHLGLTGTETPAEIDANPELLAKLEAIRAAACARLGFVADRGDATRLSPAVPKMTIVAPAKTYTCSSGEEISAEKINLTARIMSMQKAHRDYAITGAVCTLVAAKIPGTVVAGVAGKSAAGEKELSFGHPGGVITMEIDLVNSEDDIFVRRAAVARTARKLLEGLAYIPAELWR